MAGGVDIGVDFPQLDEMKDAFRVLPTNIAAKYMASALRKAIAPAYKMLRQLTPRGPTGNLKRAVRTKTKRYTRSGAGVALVGYTAAPRKKASDLKGNEKGAHQGFVEFGTKRRKTKGRIASSFSRTGKIQAIRGRRKNAKVKSSPKPPKGFVKAAKKGDTVDLGQFPIGGRKGIPPVKTTFDRTLPEMRANLPKEMRLALHAALKEMASPFRQKGRR